ncbi:2Fe-2S iron-sulfur cluster-binding protein [Mycolicibacterium palauense]|uniref:2Fe-2S iron-sulfur cluster-binding protein n=1 Tax=Mycolicibacterium palauense TaxID=2034511 RepID=UPI003899642F
MAARRALPRLPRPGLGPAGWECQQSAQGDFGLLVAVIGRAERAARQSVSVVIEPVGLVLEVAADETVMGAAERRGYRWPTLCHGEGTCSVCWAEVLSGGQNLSAMRDKERNTLELLSPHLRARRQVRLACQARVHGDVAVRKPGVRPA